ncbi:MAG: hypothetical protein JKX85_01545 [Phycisphaeraceae bacterium]|nr:hypothetical protein [Phycisphaeraceae bacterium]
MKPTAIKHLTISLTKQLVVICLLLATGCVSSPQATKTDSTSYAFWPPYPDEPHIQFLTSYSKASDVVATKSGLDELIYGKEVQLDLPINKPYGIAMYDGKIYICDLRNDCVVILDLRNKQTLAMGSKGAQKLQSPSDIAISADGYKYVADVGKGTIVVFDPQERFVTSLGPKNFKPTGVALYNDELYVSDFISQTVLVMDRHNGTIIRTIGSPGSEPGQFVKPLGIDVDKDGNIFVADVLKCQVYKFKPDGTYESTFGAISDRIGGLVRPKQITVDPDGIIYVVDAAFQNVQLFNSEGNLYTFFGSPGTHPGAMNLPAGICTYDGDLDLFAQYIHPDFQAKRLILVTNQFGANKISVYALGELKPGKTVKDISGSSGIVPSGVADENTATAKGARSLPEGATEPDLPLPPGLRAPTKQPTDATAPATEQP